MKKQVKDLVNGDIVRIEFGDYGNWETFIVCDTEIRDDSNSLFNCKVKCRYYGSDTHTEFWGHDTSLIEIIKEGE